MNNPFDLNSYKPQINMRDQERARRSAYQASRIINEKRKQGIEPSKPYAQRNMAHVAGLPQDYTTEMPKMPMHKRSVNRSKKK
jgi:hypothetical protein